MCVCVFVCPACLSVARVCVCVVREYVCTSCVGCSVVVSSGWCMYCGVWECRVWVWCGECVGGCLGVSVPVTYYICQMILFLCVMMELIVHTYVCYSSIIVHTYIRITIVV